MDIPMCLLSLKIEFMCVFTYIKFLQKFTQTLMTQVPLCVLGCSMVKGQI